MSVNKPKSVVKSGKNAADAAADGAAVQPATTAERAGKIKFDDRGNAIWEWALASGAFARDPVNERLKRLENPSLSIANDAPTPYEIARPNPLGTVKGYNPYDSGKLDKAAAAPPKKKDLRRLSEWMKLKKLHQSNKGEEDDEE